jgi:hypothetical protein
MFEPKPIEDFDGSRVNSLGASDMPTLALLNKRWGQTPYTLWQEKTGRAEPFRGNNRTYWGHMLEGLVLRQFVKNHDLASPTGFYMAYLARKYRARRNIRIYTEFRHPDYPWAMSHPDLVVLGDVPRIQEAKTAGFFGARRDDDPDFGYSDEDFSQNGIPAAVFLQVQWQLFTAGIREGGVSLLADTANYREYGPIIADPRTQEKLLALGERFMWHVEHDEPPKPEIWADVVSLYPEVEETTAMVGGDELSMATQMIAEYHDAASKIKKLEARREEVKNALGLWIGGNKILVSSEGAKLASQGKVSSEYFDLKKLRTEKPETYEELKAAGFVNEKSWRNLYISKLK